MKIYLIIVLSLFIVLPIQSQDVLKLKNGRIIECKIEKEDSLNYYILLNQKDREIHSYIVKSEINNVETFSEIKSKRDSVYSKLFKKGTNLFGINGSYASSNGGSSALFSTSINNFVVSNFFIGGTLSYLYQQVGDLNESSFGIGPNLGLVANGEGANPFVEAGIGLNFSSTKNSNTSSGGQINSSSNTAISYFVGAGLIIPLNQRVGLIIEGQYNWLHVFSDSQSSINKDHIYGVAFGLNALL
jgi:opacity protein-like surface antigen